MPDPSAPITWGVIGSLGTLTTVLGAVVAKGWPIWRRASEFLEDWNGEPERPGVKRKPGVMERLGSVEATLSEQGVAIASLAASQTQRAATEQQMAEEIRRLQARIDAEDGR